MIYKFKSKASGDVIMLGPNGDQVLRIIGREPASKGIIEVEAMPAAIAALEAAVRDDAGAAEVSNADEDAPKAVEVALHQRVWPVIDMLQRCLKAGEPVVWGV
jgi:Domain of unknown function (DUF1840)